jgi:linoleoyl-CoA desaturase
MKDFEMFATKQYGNNIYYDHPKKEYFILFASKFLYLVYSLIIPLIFIHLVWWKILLGFTVMHLVLGVLVALILFPVHAQDDSPYPTPDQNGMIDNSWAIHQVETTSNFGSNSWILCWLCGGLNTHIVHHIFPSVCHIHYYDLTKIIRKIAKKHEINFRDNTIAGALFHHLNFLRIMGRSEVVGLSV